MSRGLTFAKLKQIRWYSTKQKEKMQLIGSVDELLVAEEIKHRKHPGVVLPKYVEQPNWLLDTVKTLLSDETISPQVISEIGKKLGFHLNARHVPLEKEELSFKLHTVQSRVFKGKSEQEIDTEDPLKVPKVQKLFKELVYNWKPIDYDKYTSLSYLVNRSTPEYCVLYKLFNEINTYDTNFKPKTLFDFGSGVGTVMWAASQFWDKSIKEYVCIDVSQDMHDLSEYLSKRGKPQIKPQYIFYRQFLPVTPTPYDIVVSAYSLFELPDQRSRLEILSKLWQKTHGYLVIVEKGTRAGFNLVNEAREFLLNYKKDTVNGYVVSPCPHDFECPRFMTDDTPCNFQTYYLTLPVYGKAMYKRELYSYVILKKGERPENDCRWSRIVRATLKRSGHVVCRLCTASGQLQEQIFTKWKNGKNTYRCARSSEWGDRLPFEIEKLEESEPGTFEDHETEKLEDVESEKLEDRGTENPSHESFK